MEVLLSLPYYTHLDVGLTSPARYPILTDQLDLELGGVSGFFFSPRIYCLMQSDLTPTHGPAVDCTCVCPSPILLNLAGQAGAFQRPFRKQIALLLGEPFLRR